MFDGRVQLRTDAATTPVEDAGVDWPQQTSPYRSVATVTLPPQETCSNARRVFADDRLGRGEDIATWIGETASWALFPPR